jgi:hypothetical protein
MTTVETNKVDKALDLIDQIAKFNAAHEIRYEIAKLRKIREWALSRLDVQYRVGDRVRLRYDLFNGENDDRQAYSECATEGATARVVEIDFHGVYDYWYAGIVFDEEWTIMPNHDRYWHGAIGETPLGMVPPTAFDVEHYPEGRRHVFSVHVQQIEKVTD